MRHRPSIHLHIEELVLDGFPPGDRHRIGDAMQLELARLFAGQVVPSTLTQSSTIDRLDAGAFQTARAPQPQTTGVQIARALFGKFSQ